LGFSSPGLIFTVQPRPVFVYFAWYFGFLACFRTAVSFSAHSKLSEQKRIFIRELLDSFAQSSADPMPGT
jgi:hypothetical protein